MFKIKELQQLDESSKKRWLLILTSISVVVVLVLWAFYLNATVVSVNNVNTKHVSNWDIFKTGLNVIGGKVEYGLANSYVFFHEKIKDGNTFTITK